MLKARIERIERRLAALGGREKRFKIVYSNGEHAYCVNAGDTRLAVFKMPRPKAPVSTTNGDGGNSHSGGDE